MEERDSQPPLCACPSQDHPSREIGRTGCACKETFTSLSLLIFENQEQTKYKPPWANFLWLFKWDEIKKVQKKNRKKCAAQNEISEPIDQSEMRSSGKYSGERRGMWYIS